MKQNQIPKRLLTNHSGQLIFLIFIAAACVWMRAGSVPPPVHIQIQADREEGPWKPVWNFFGYDEPNYTYAPNGKKLLHELSALSPTPVHIRAHNLFTSGDGSASLKWGSTNVYSEDANGKPVYNWTIIDRIFDTYHEAGIKPLVELGFMPEALSTNPEPYRHSFPHGNLFTGWSYPPKDYAKWGDLVFHFVQHLRQRYGDAETASWMWEVWNEPDIPYWHGRAEEYFKLYDYAADAVVRALPNADIGGPDSTGPGNAKAADFLRAFLEHCAHGTNYATGKRGAPLRFISFHPKGSAKFEDGHVVMGSSHHLQAVEHGFEVVKSFPEWQNTPVVLGESDPEGCAACAVAQHPEDGYRNSSLYAAYTIEVLSRVQSLAAEKHINFRGAVTWAFEFEGQPYFIGFRDLSTNGIDKPVLNGFRMLGLLEGTRVAASSSQSLPTDEVLRAGVRGQPDINVIATRNHNEISALVWNYSDEDADVAGAPVDVGITGLPSAQKSVLVQHFRLDGSHSNAFAEWKALGSPQNPSPEQYSKLEAAGQLQLLGSPQWMKPEDNKLRLQFDLPRQGLSLIRVSW